MKTQTYDLRFKTKLNDFSIMILVTPTALPARSGSDGMFCLQ